MMIDTIKELIEGHENEIKSIAIVFNETSEGTAEQIQTNFRGNQNVGCYILGKDSIDYKSKKDKEGNILDERWIVTERMDFEVM